MSRAGEEDDPLLGVEDETVFSDRVGLALPQREPHLIEEFNIEPSSSIDVNELSKLVSGCRDDPDGTRAKLRLVLNFAETNSGTLKGDFLQLLRQHHQLKCITLDAAKLLAAVTFVKPASGPAGNYRVKEASHPGFFLFSVLASATDSSEMEALYTSFVTSNPGHDEVRM